MSRIGKLPINIPSNVDVQINGQKLLVKGPYGQLDQELSKSINISTIDNQIVVKPNNESRSARQLYGLSRTLINNMLIGVSEKFERRLEIKGVGYRAQLQGKNLILNLGYSHPITIIPPEGIEITIESNTIIIVKGADKEKVGQIAALIRNKRPPEPYKGKGVLYEGEIIKRKAGKSGK